MALSQLQVTSRVNVATDQIEANVRDAVTRVVTQWHIRPCRIIGGGPSLNPATYVPHPDVTTFALNNAGAMVPSDYVIMMDARPENASMDVVRHARRATYLLASQVHPDVYDRLEAQRADIQQWHAGGADVLKALGIRGVGGGGTVLTRAVPIAFEMGFRQFHLYGVDSSYAEDGAHHAYPQALNDGAETVEVFTPHKRTRFVTTGALAEQAQQCIAQWQSFEQFGCEFRVYGEGLLPTLWREAKEHKADLDASEPEKYRRMWANPAYRKWSPGEDKSRAIQAALGIDDRPATVIDFGCGTGRLAHRLAAFHSVTGVDFADNCLDAEVRAEGRFPLVVANLWDYRGSAEVGVCTDVMEHIPTEKVDAVLANIAASVQRAAFTISFVPDNFGRSIGQPLHLTVKPPAWWQTKLGEHFATVTYQGDGLFICER